jgi:hypothetical protein
MFELVEAKRHGLGLYLSPTGERGWEKEAWGLVRQLEAGHQPHWPGWADYPVVSRTSLSSPTLLKPFVESGVPVRPFSFFLVAYVAPLGQPVGVDSGDVRPVAPFQRDPEKWVGLRWVNGKSGATISVVSGKLALPGEVRLKTYREMLLDFAMRAETSAAGPDGAQCQPITRGSLDRLRVQVPGKVLIGKEAHNIEQALNGLTRDPEDVCQTLTTKVPDWLVAEMRDVTASEIARAVGSSARYVKAIRNRKQIPSGEVLRDLIASLPQWKSE